MGLLACNDRAGLFPRQGTARRPGGSGSGSAGTPPASGGGWRGAGGGTRRWRPAIAPPRAKQVILALNAVRHVRGAACGRPSGRLGTWAGAAGESP